jgi:RNA polymerase sigma-70 factor (ECF subfamily)
MPDLPRGRAEELLRRIAESRDSEAFTEFYDHYAPRIRAHLLRRTSDPSVAEEVCQEVMISAWRRASTFRADRASASTWIYAIARNRWIDRVRKEARREPQPTDPAFVRDPEDAGEQLDRQRRAVSLRRALENLPEDQSATLRRAYYRHQSSSEIAEATGVPLGTVKSRIRMAFARLRRELENE